MRAYVITGEIDDPECGQIVVAVTSSKKSAMVACENYINAQDDAGNVNGKMRWHNAEKHTGWASRGEHIAYYQMFFVNRDYQ